MSRLRICVIMLAGLALFSGGAMAQLLGDYYIGSRPGSAPGGANPDFPTLDSANTVLRDTLKGIVGPTTFYLLDSTYTIPGATLARIRYLGASATNTMRIKPYTGVKATINFSTPNASSTGQLQFGDESFPQFSPKYFTIDGSNTAGGTTRDLTFNFTGQVGIRVFVNSSQITVKNCIINSTYRVGTSTSNVVSISMQYRTAAPLGYFYPDTCLVENCQITHSGYQTGGGVSLNRGTAPADLNVGTTGVIIRNNVITGRDRGISVEHAIGTQIYGNTIRVNQDSIRNAYGIYFLRTAGTVVQTSNIYNNKFDTLTTANTSAANGLSGIFVGGLATGTTNIYNNFIAGFSTPASTIGYVSGILVDSISSANVNVYHNSIYIPAVALTDSVFGVFIRNTSAAGANVTLKNNIIAVAENDDSSYCVMRAGSAGTFVSDWNVLSAGGSTVVGSWQGTPQATLAAWRTASSQDANSKNVNPASPLGGVGQWTSATNLHFTSKPSNDFACLPVGGITTDIDGHARGSNPYMGADEIPGSPLVVGVEESPDGTPLTFGLEGNYPNPFNPSTTIRYTIAKSSFVTLEVHNVLGQRVATLVQEQATPGTYSIQWNGMSEAGVKASSGVYYYRLRAGEFRETRSMVLAK